MIQRLGWTFSPIQPIVMFQQLHLNWDLDTCPATNIYVDAVMVNVFDNSIR